MRFPYVCSVADVLDHAVEQYISLLITRVEMIDVNVSLTNL